jgi:acyl transferase domain-containing protein/acyl carrier protein
MAQAITASGAVPLIFSSRSAEGLRAQGEQLRAFISGDPGLDLSDAAYSLATTRSALDHRAVVLGPDRDGLLAGLAAVAAGEPAPGVVRGAVPAAGTGRIVFVFPGQGSQWAGMGRDLARQSPVFAARLGECGRALGPYVDWSLDAVIAEAGGAPDLERVDVVQPVLWAVMVSLAAVWEAAGVVPDAVVGHSQGEIAAACVAGILSLDDAAKVVALRSQALRTLAGAGGMLSIAEPAEQVRQRMAGRNGAVSVAAVNGTASTVVSGEPEVLADLAAHCASDNVRARMLPVNYASHSPQVEVLQEQIVADLAGTVPQPARRVMVSAMTGELVTGPELDARYWYESLRAPVEFDRAIRKLAARGDQAFVEVSPHPVLAVPMMDTLENIAAANAAPPTVTGTLRRDEGGLPRFLASAAALWVRGTAVNWAGMLAGGQRVDLPTYPFQRQRYWPEPIRRRLTGGGDGAGSAEEARFWAAVDGGDLQTLAAALEVDAAQPFSAVVPALSSWRRAQRDRSAIDGWRYRVTWEPVPDRPAPELTGTWLVMAPAGLAQPLATSLIQALSGHGATAVLVQAGPPDTDRVVLAKRIEQALTGVAAAGAADLAGVVSLLGLADEAVPECPAVTTGLALTQALVQALGDAAIDVPMWALTVGALTTGPGDGPGRPAQAQVWGLGRVVALEHPGRWGGLVDLPSQPDTGAWDRVCGVLAQAPGATDAEDQVAIRAGRIMARRLAGAPLPAGGAVTWQPRGTTLITGGTGGTAGHVARWLAGAGAPRVVLASRTGPQAASGPALAAELATAGTTVTISATDVTQRESVRAVVAQIAATGPELRAVIHTAGVGQGTAVADTSLAELAAVADAKVTGARLLDELTRDLDAFVLFSSVAATWGSGRQPGYAAANAFLDSLAEQRHAAGQAATSIAWGLWGGGGMGIGEAGAQLRRRGLRVMDPRQAATALAAAVTTGDPTITVADIDWVQFAPAYTLQRPSPLLSLVPEFAAALDVPADVTDEARDALVGQLTGQPETEQDRIVERLVRTETAAILGHPSFEAIDPHQSFRDLGADSLTAVEIRNRLTAVTGLVLPATLIFDHPDPATLARFIRGELAGNDAGRSSPALAEIDRLESVLAELSPGDSSRADVTARLQAILSKLLRAQEDEEAGTVSEKLQSATADEVMKFIDEEFRLS